MPNIPSHSPRYRSSGITLTEMLVALCLLGIALAAAGHAMGKSIALTADNILRMRAIRLASDLAELSNGTADGAALAMESPAHHDCRQTICNPTLFARNLLARWHGRVAILLADGEGIVTADTIDSVTTLAVTLRWQDSTGDPASYTRRVRIAR